MALRFDHLISGLAGAVVEAQHQVRQAHIGELWNYFKEGSPISVQLQIPRTSPVTGRQEPVTVGVPLITLVAPGQMSIQEMQISMHVDMSEITEAALSESQQRKTAEKTGVPPLEWKPPEYKAMIATSTTTGKKPGQVGMAQVTLTVKAEPTPEGLARLLDHLNKVL